MDQVLPSAQVIERLQSAFAVAPLEASAPGETAQRWTYLDAGGHPDTGAGEIGVISSVTQAFCGDCNRARLSTEGQLYLCLFASTGHDLRSLVRAGADDTALAGAISAIWGQREDRYSMLRTTSEPGAPSQGERRVEMSYIGG